MTYTLFEKIGMTGFDLSYIIIGMVVAIIALLIMVIILMVKNRKLSKTYRQFMTGRTVKSLETEIINLFEDNKTMKEQINNNRHDIRNINKQLRTVYQRCAIIRYDALREMGGKLSFCLVLLNENNDGFILNSVHSSAGCYSYLKEVTGGRCAIALGNEEQQALDQALGKED